MIPTTIFMAPGLAHDLRTIAKPSGDPLFGFSPHIQESAFFPFDLSCEACGGSGEDRGDSADCRTCRATGFTRHIGCFFGNGGMVAITAKLPRLFAPRFPRGLVKPRNAVRIVL